MKRRALILFTLPKCPSCPKAKEVCKSVAEELGLEFKEIDMSKEPEIALMYQTTIAPTIALDEETLFKGEVPNKKKLIQEIKKQLA